MNLEMAKMLGLNADRISPLHRPFVTSCCSANSRMLLQIGIKATKFDLIFEIPRSIPSFRYVLSTFHTSADHFQDPIVDSRDK